jgi:Fe-S cluster assembly protein SufD
METQVRSKDPFRFIKNQEEPDWIQVFRNLSWEKYQTGSWTSFDIESWRYTKPQDFLKVLSQDNTEDQEKGVMQDEFSNTELDSHIVPFFALAPEDVIRVNQIQALSEAHSESDRFKDLHGALFDHAYFISASENEAIEIPLEISSPIYASSPFFVVDLAPGSKVKIVIPYSSEYKHDFCHERLLCRIGKGASLELISLNQLPETVLSLQQHEVFLQENAEFEATYLPTGSSLSRVVQEVYLLGKEAVAKTNGLIFGHQKQKFDFNAYQFHQAPSSRSELFFRNVVAHQSKAIFIGHVYVDEKAKSSSAYQTNKNLILSEQAEATSIPKLEIDTEDVQCGHGMTVSTLNEDELFYLESRGLPRSQAKRMILSGFFDAVVNRIPNKQLREQARTVLDKRLEEVSL